MFSKPNPKQNFFDLEQQILNWWKEQQILEKSINQRPDDQSKTFYDGPITANGEPHHGHMLTFAMKDIIPRYWTMKGYKVSRSLGWDCQGIPVEYEVEKKLGFTEKKDIEKYGVAAFNQLCRESVEKYRGNIIELEELMGRLTNSDEEFATMDRDYIESVWWSLSELYKKGLLYEGFKVVPYSTRAGTTLSNAEVALGGYKPFVDPAITVEFPLKDDPKTILLAWTTTPWTIPSNLGLAVGKDIKYVKVKSQVPDNTYIVAKDLIKQVFKDDPVEIIGEVAVGELVGKEYTPPFDFYAGRKNVHKIYEGFHVTTDSGTGIVHLAPYGAEDNEIFQKVGIESFDYLDEQGDFISTVPMYAGINYRDANPKIIEDLKAKDALFRNEEYEHEMPMCWRTNTPLIYKPITSWFIAMSSLRKELVDNNNKINWIPSHVKDGRFGNWLSEIKDWGISRLRYWGTPLPVWKSASGKIIFIGSFEEIEKYTGKKVEDPHKPFIDDFVFEYEGETYKRIPDVIDVWYDSGAMPFARFHYPFENEEKFKKKFPAQYIAEGVDQTRGWFYSLHAIGTALMDSPAFENVVMNGFVLDDKGAKLSKSKKNYTAPKPLIEKFGADTIRLNFFSTAISAGEDTTVSEKTLNIQKQETILPLWNIYSFFTTYANLHNWEPRSELCYNNRENKADEFPWDHMPFNDLENNLDAWILLLLQETIKEVTSALDKYEIPRATRSAKSFIDDLSKWYIRRNRDRFASGDTDALDTLYYVLVECLKLFAPITPFITEYIYKELVASQLSDMPESVHLTNYPTSDTQFIEQYSALLEEMRIIREVCEMGHSLRTTNQLKVRQPLAKVELINTNVAVPAFSDWMKKILMDELNVKDVVEVMQFSSKKVINTENAALSIKVGLDTEITQDLLDEGLVRDITREIQSIRKNMSLDIGDKITLSYQTNDVDLNRILENFKETILNSINAAEILNVESIKQDTKQEIDLNGKKVTINLVKK